MALKAVLKHQRLKCRKHELRLLPIANADRQCPGDRLSLADCILRFNFGGQKRTQYDNVAQFSIR